MKYSRDQIIKMQKELENRKSCEYACAESNPYCQMATAQIMRQLAEAMEELEKIHGGEV